MQAEEKMAVFRFRIGLGPKNEVGRNAGIKYECLLVTPNRIFASKNSPSRNHICYKMISSLIFNTFALMHSIRQPMQGYSAIMSLILEGKENSRLNKIAYLYLKKYFKSSDYY